MLAFAGVCLGQVRLLETLVYFGRLTSDMAKVETVNLHAAKTHLSRFVEKAHAGTVIVLAKAGRPYAQLGPLDAPRKRRLGFVAGKVDEAVLAPLTREEMSDWDASPLVPKPLQLSVNKQSRNRKRPKVPLRQKGK